MPKARPRKWHYLYNKIYCAIRADTKPGVQQNWADAITVLRGRGVHPEALIANACWYVFLDASALAGFSAEKIAEGVGHDWHSLKNLARTARRAPVSLEKRTARMTPDRLLSPDLLTGPTIVTPQEKLALLAKTVPRIPRFMEEQRAAAHTEKRVVIASLRRLQLSYHQIARLLDIAADALCITDEQGKAREYDPQVLLMRYRRSSS